jgi:uncharacterized repeat protein (TIGR01451 family)
MMLLAQLTYAQLSPNTVKYQLTYDPNTGRYTVWVVPDYNTPNAFNALNEERGATAQVTIKVPTSFVIIPESIVDIKGDWSDAPPKLDGGSFGLDPAFSYYIFNKSPLVTTYGPFVQNTPVALFSFLGNSCFGPVSIIPKTDPFITAANADPFSLNVENSFYSRSGQSGNDSDGQTGGNQEPLEQFIEKLGPDPECRTDLMLTKTVSNITPNVGSNVVFTLVVTNNGPGNATGVIVSDQLASGFTFVSDDGLSALTYNENTGTWTIGNLPAGSSATLNITAQVNATGSYTNYAQVLSANELDIDSSPGNGPQNIDEDDDDQLTAVPVPVADLSVTKTDGSTTYTPGTSVNYTLSVSNAGPSDVTGATVTDSAPAGTTITSWTATFAGGATGSGGGVGNISQPVNLPLGGTATYTVTVAVPVNYTGSLVNTATITAPAGVTDPNLANNSATDTDTQNSQTDLAVTKSVNNNTPKVGDNVTFTLMVQNNGPSNASGVAVADQLPSGYTYVSDNGGGAYASDVWTIGNLASGASATLTITAKVNPTGNYTNSATVTGNQQDPIPGNNTSTSLTTPTPVTDLSVAKTVNVNNPNVGSSIVFTVTATNNGPSAATGVTVLDMLPSGYAYVSDNGGTTYNTGTGVWTIGNLASGSSTSLNITATVLATGGYANTAIVSGQEFDPIANNNSASSSPLPSPVADIAIAKSASNGSPNVGSNVVFTLFVTNSGPSAATGVAVFDQLPSGYTYVSDDGLGAYNSGTGIWTIGNLANGGNKVLNITALVNAAGTYTNTASATADQSDFTPGNNTSSSSTTPIPVAELAISITDGSATYTPGTLVTYTVVVSNAGPSGVAGAAVTNNAPSGTTITSWSAIFAGGASGAGAGSGNISELVSIPLGGSITYSVTVAVPAGYSGPLTSTATIAAPAGVTDPNLANNTATDTDTQNSSVDLAINKSVDESTPKVGDNVTFTLMVTNNGPSDASGVTATDLLPSGYTYVSNSGLGTYSNLTGTWTIGSLLSGASTSLSITAKVNPTGNYTNSATVTGDQPDPLAGNNTSTSATTPEPVTDLSVTKTSNVNNPNVGTNVIFTVVATNNGPSTATGITVLDHLPSGYAYVSDNGGGTYASGSGVWTIGSLPSGGSSTLNITATVLATGGYANTALISGQEFDPNTANNTATSSPLPSPVADIAILKTVDNPTPNVGSKVVFTLTIGNNGPSTSTGVAVLDLPTSGYTYVSDDGLGTYNSGTGVWNVGNLANGATAILHVTATVNAQGNYTNTASASSDEIDPAPGNNTSSVTPVPVPVAELSVTITDGNATYTPGTTVTYTIVVSNDGPSDVTGALFANNAPSGTTITGWTASFAGGASGTGVGSGDISELVNLPLGGNITYTVTVNVPSSYTGTLTSTATIATPAGVIDPVPGNNSATDVDNVNSVTDLAITKSVDINNPDVGTDVVFTVTVTNNGPSDATGVTVFDQLPSGYAYVTDNVGAAYNSGTGLWTINGLAIGASVSLNITATVLATGGYVNTATVSGNEFDPNTLNNSASASPLPSPVADIAITKSVSNSTPNVGSNVVFTLVVTNNGPSAATGVAVSDQLPSGYTYVSDDGLGTYVSGTGIWSIGNLANGGTKTLSITALVNAAGNYSNSATANGEQTDPNAANNTATSATSPVPVAELSVTITDGIATYTPGTSVTYTVVVSNAGPSDVTGASLTNLAPVGTTITTWSAAFTGGASGTGGGSGDITELVNLPLGSTITYTVTVAVPQNYTGNLVSTATIAAPAGVTDPNLANNTATDTDTQNSQTDLEISKSVDESTPKVGDNVTFTLMVTNNGPSAASGVTVTDLLPSGYSYASNSAGGAYVPGTGIWTVGSLASGASASLSTTATVNPTGNYVNSATVTGNQPDPIAGNNTSTSTTTPVPVADLSVTKISNVNNPNVGTNVVFTIVATNNGPSTATGVTVFDKLPSGYAYVSNSVGGAYVPATGLWTIGTLASGGSATLSITATVLATGGYANTAIVSGQEFDPNTNNNSASSSPLPSPVADVSIAKSVNVATPNVGSNVIFTLVASNNGPSAATGVTVLDQLPSGYTYVSDDGLGNYTNGTGVWTVGNLANGATATLNITVKVDAAGSYSNSANATSDQTDPNAANNSATTTTDPVPVADLAITITDGSLTYTPGTPVTYTVVVTNAGPSDVTGASVAYTAPAGTTITGWSATFAGGASGTAAGSGTISELVNIPLGATVTYSVTLAVPAAYTGALTSSVSVSPPSGVTDPDLTNNTATDTDTQNSSTDLAITKVLDLNLPQVGASASFTLTVTNNGPSNASGVTVSDLLPAGYTYVSDNSGGSYNSTSGTWAVGNLANGGTASLTIATTVNAAGPYLNTATVTGNQTDPNLANNQASAGLQQLQLLPKVYLQGALFGVTFSNPPANTVVDPLMRDELRTKNLIPLTSPYGFWNPTLPANTIAPAVLTVSGPDAIVDWVFVELRSAADPTVIVSSRSALLQRDGDIVELDGTSPIQVRAASSQAYFVAVRHRNHLAVMTASPITLTPSGVVVDFRQPATPTFVKGPAAIHQAQVVVVQGRAMWAGNALRDNVVIYQGTNNDVNVVAQQVINAPANTFKLPFFILKGYFSGDINMNGEVIFQGTRNDVEFIYQNVIKNHPGNGLKDNFFIIQQQLPE